LWILADRKSAQELAHPADRYLLVKPIVTSAAILLALANVLPAFAQAQGTGQEPCTQAGDSSKTLSEKLDQGGGVICPPNVDPAIKAPTPQTGKMPVIPPPGSPGGDPKVQPK
jgi:hypothetical protein